MVALVGFWSAALMKKGSPRHRALGKVYLLAMATIVATALPITVEYAVFRRQPLSALFLAYLMALTGNAAWRAGLARGHRQARLEAAGGADRLEAGAVADAVAGAGHAAGGHRPAPALFLGFMTIGLWVGWRMWKFACRGPLS